MNVRFGILDFGQRHGLLGVAQCVASVRVLEFDDRADIAGSQRGHARARLAVEQIYLADLFRAPPVRIVKFAAKLDRARVNPEERQLAELGFAHRLEDIKDRVGISQRHVHLVPIPV